MARHWQARAKLVLSSCAATADTARDREATVARERALSRFVPNFQSHSISAQLARKQTQCQTSGFLCVRAAAAAFRLLNKLEVFDERAQ